MERKNGLLVVLSVGIMVSVTGFALAWFLPTLIIIGLIVAVFLYLDYRESHKEGQKALKKNAAVAIFVIVTAYCMITGLWVFWAGIVFMLYTDAVLDSFKEWLDTRQERSLEAMKILPHSSAEDPVALQSIRQSLLNIETRMKALEWEKNK